MYLCISFITLLRFVQVKPIQQHNLYTRFMTKHLWSLTHI